MPRREAELEVYDELLARFSDSSYTDARALLASILYEKVASLALVNSLTRPAVVGLASYDGGQCPARGQLQLAQQ